MRKGPCTAQAAFRCAASAPPDDVSNVALCRNGASRVEVTRRAGSQRRDSWAVLRPVRVEVEDVAKFLTGEAAVAHAAPDRAHK